MTIETTPLAKVFDAVLLITVFAFNAVVLEADVASIVVAFLGAISGAIMLAYFRRDTRKLEQLFKVLTSAIGGIVLGTVLGEYLNVQSHAYRLGVFFLSSMLSLVILRSLLHLTEKNATDVLRGALTRALNLKAKEDRQEKKPCPKKKPH